MIWHTGPLEEILPGDALWRVRLDEAIAQEAARGVRLRGDDLRDLAHRPQAAMRALRRQLTKALLARMAGCHPDTIALTRTLAGAPVVTAPEGWHISVAGRWPYAAIGVSRMPLGVDIEPIDALPPPGDALTPQEQREATTDAERLRRWVAKEAHAKLLGIASSIDPADIHTQAEGAALRVHSAQGATLCHITQTGHTLLAVARSNR